VLHQHIARLKQLANIIGTKNIYFFYSTTKYLRM